MMQRIRTCMAVLLAAAAGSRVGATQCHQGRHHRRAHRRPGAVQPRRHPGHRGLFRRGQQTRRHRGPAAAAGDRGRRRQTRPGAGQHQEADRAAQGGGADRLHQRRRRRGEPELPRQPERGAGGAGHRQHGHPRAAPQEPVPHPRRLQRRDAPHDRRVGQHRCQALRDRLPRRRGAGQPAGDEGGADAEQPHPGGRGADEPQCRGVLDAGRQSAEEHARGRGVHQQRQADRARRAWHACQGLRRPVRHQLVLRPGHRRRPQGTAATA